MKITDLIKKILFGENKIASPVPLTSTSTSTPTPTPTPTPNYERGIREGLKEYFKGEMPPVATLSSTFVEEAQKNKLNPYLLPAISVIETQGGRQETVPNNPLNWGIKAEFYPQTPQETIKKAASGIGTIRAFPYYEEYRRTGRIEDLAKHYAPPSENDMTNWVNVVKKAISLMKKYE